MHQRGFACAVLAEDRVDFAGQNLEIYSTQRHGRAEPLDDTTHLDRHYFTASAPATIFSRAASIFALRSAGILADNCGLRTKPIVPLFMSHGLSLGLKAAA